MGFRPEDTLTDTMQAKMRSTMLFGMLSKTMDKEQIIYIYAFAFWNTEHFTPKYKIAPTESAKNIFHTFRGIKRLESKYIDLSQVPRGANEGVSMAYTFYDCRELEEIEDIGLSPSFSYHGAFANDVNLKKIAKITVDSNTRLGAAFNYCHALEEVIFDGNIGDSVDLHWSKKLTKASIQSVINHLMLSPSIADGKTLTLSKAAVDSAIEGHIWSEEHQSPIFVTGRGSETETWEQLIAPAKDAGWTITLV